MKKANALNLIEVSEYLNSKGITKAYHQVTKEQEAKALEVLKVDKREIENDGNIFELIAVNAEGNFIRAGYYENGNLVESFNENEYKEFSETFKL